MDKDLKKIEQVFKEMLNITSVEPNMELKSLGLDSLDLVEVMMRLEEEFGIEFTNDEMLGFETIADVTADITKKLN